MAEGDLHDIGDYIALDNPQRAESFVEELTDQAKKITQMPTGYVAREDLVTGLRIWAHGRYIHFLFRISDDAVRTARVLHSSRHIATDDFLG